MPNLSEMTTTTAAPDEALEYARRLYSSVRDWYETADRKAQLVLTLDGVFVTFVSTSLAAKPTELSQTVSAFGPETWVLLGAALASLVLSLFSCLVCLVSRHAEARTSFLRLLFHDLKVDPKSPNLGQLDTDASPFCLRRNVVHREVGGMTRILFTRAATPRAWNRRIGATAACRRSIAASTAPRERNRSSATRRVGGSAEATGPLEVSVGACLKSGRGNRPGTGHGGVAARPRVTHSIWLLRTRSSAFSDRKWVDRPSVGRRVATQVGVSRQRPPTRRRLCSLAVTITYPIRTLKHCAPEAFVVVDDEGGMARYVERLVADEKLSREHVLLAAGRLESDNFTDDELIQTVAGIAANPEADTSEQLESLKASRPIGGFVADASARSSIHLVRSVDYSPAKGPTCCESCGNRTEARAPDVLDLRHDPTDRGARKNAAVGAQLLPLSRAARGLPVGTRAIAMTKTNMGSGSPPTRMWPRYRQRQRSPAMVGFAYSSQTPLDVPRLAEVLSFKVREGPRTEMGHTEA